jgi:hypothetical protein
MNCPYCQIDLSGDGVEADMHYECQYDGRIIEHEGKIILEIDGSEFIPDSHETYRLRCKNCGKTIMDTENMYAIPVDKRVTYDEEEWT